mgnify:CR=1 FL=1|jgi:hypothetical protein
MASQGGGSGLTKTQILELFFGDNASSYPVTSGTGWAAIESMSNQAQQTGSDHQ